MKFIKLISAALAFLLIFGGCNKAQEDELPPGFDDTSDEEIEIAALEPYTLRIPYDYEEGLSPYTTKSRTNRFICGLIYRSMVTLGSDYSYNLDLLSDISTEDNLTWYLYVDESLTFPNGTEFTAYDLRYSIQQAMVSGSYYASSLAIISSVGVVNASCCKVTLRYADRYFPNLLTFPVISYETVKHPLYFPGRYSLSQDQSSLVCSGDSAIQTIELISANDQALLPYEMRTGRYDCIYWRSPTELGTSSTGGMSGLQSNRMVYLGLNGSSAYTYYSDFRKAVAAAIDYSEIVDEVYENFAAAPRNLFNPDFYEMQYVSRKSVDLMSANLLLDGLGFTKKDGDGFRLNSRGKRISLKLVVCSESAVKVAAANAVAEMLGEVGIEVNVYSLSYSAYMVALQNYDYDIYVAEVEIGADMDISKLITPIAYQLEGIEYAGYGISNNENLYLTWLGFMAGTVTPSEFSAAFAEVMPYVPICYTKSCVVFSRDLPFSFSGTDFDMFYGIENRQLQ